LIYGQFLAGFYKVDDSVNVIDIKKPILLQLNQLSIALNSYFSKDICENFQWIENPFTISIEHLNFNTVFENQIIEFFFDKLMKIILKIKLS